MLAWLGVKRQELKYVHTHSSCYQDVKKWRCNGEMLAMNGHKIKGVADPSSNQDAATKNYVVTLGTLKLNKAGDAMTEALSMGNNRITDVGTPQTFKTRLLGTTLNRLEFQNL